MTGDEIDAHVEQVEVLLVAQKANLAARLRAGEVVPGAEIERLTKLRIQLDSARRAVRLCEMTREPFDARA